jgi:hypothetical protein
MSPKSHPRRNFIGARNALAAWFGVGVPPLGSLATEVE